MAVRLTVDPQARAGFAGFAQLGRVFVLEAKPLASVLALFLIVLFLSSAVMHVLERNGQPAAFGTLPAALWWAVVTLTTTGYGDEVPQRMPATCSVAWS